jgi:YD repeat-containing protein
LAGFDFVLQRTYNSRDDRDGLFGFGWSSLLDMSLRLAGDGSVEARYADGSSVYFRADGGEYLPGQAGVSDTLTRNGPAFSLNTPGQIFYNFEVSGAQGRLVSIHDRFDNTITLERDGDGRIVHILDPAGCVYDLTYDGDHIASISDPAGRIISYSYDDNGDLIGVTDGHGGRQQFEYVNHRMIRLTYLEGVIYLQNFYDAEGRVNPRVDGGDTHDHVNDDPDEQTPFADNLRSQTEDSHADRFQVTETVDTLGRRESFVYDDDYLSIIDELLDVSRKIYPKDNLVSYRMRLIIAAAEKYNLDANELAYVFATVHHESVWGAAMEEIASGHAYEGRYELANTQPGDGVKYKGRGFVQLTGRTNYQQYTNILGIDLLNNPELAADHKIAAEILIHGMVNGTLTGRKLADYSRGDEFDFVQARAIVNGPDRAEDIATIAREYAAILAE